MLGLGVCLLLWVPQAVFSRLTVPSTSPDGTTDARTKVYEAAWVHLPEYGLTGVGAGNFWEGPWGKHSGYFKRHRSTGGAQLLYSDYDILGLAWPFITPQRCVLCIQMFTKRVWK